METGAGQSTRRLLPLRPLAKTYADRLLVVGDARGFTKPTKAVRFRGLAAAFFLATLATVLAGVVVVRSRAKGYFTTQNDDDRTGLQGLGLSQARYAAKASSTQSS